MITEERREFMRQYNLMYRAKHRERELERSRQWKLDNPKRNAELSKLSYHRNRESICAERRRKYAEDPVKALKQNAISRAKRREKHNAYQRKYQKDNPLWMIAASQVRLARKRGATIEKVTASDIANLYRTNPYCLYCGKKLTKKSRTLDHLTALSRGGAHCLSNLKPCCRTCNQKKGVKVYTPKTATPLSSSSRS